MRRGQLWTAAGGGHDAGKPRPVLIVQDDLFDATDSVTICPLTSDLAVIPLLRIPLVPGPANGLTRPSSLMVDKLTTMARAKLDSHAVSVAGLLVPRGRAGRADTAGPVDGGIPLSVSISTLVAEPGRDVAAGRGTLDPWIWTPSRPPPATR